MTDVQCLNASNVCVALATEMVEPLIRSVFKKNFAPVIHFLT